MIPWAVFAGGLVGIVLASMTKNRTPYIIYMIAVTQISESVWFWYLTLIVLMMPAFGAIFDE